MVNSVVRRFSVWCLLLVVQVAAFSAPRADSFEVNIRVDAAAPLGATNPKLLGSNLPWIYGSEELFDITGKPRPKMMQRAKALSPPILRYMSGEPVLHFRWRNGIGPLADRPMVQPAAGQPAQPFIFGTQEFLETCEALGSEPLIQVNMFEGSAADLARETADWVKYTNGQKLISRNTGKVLPKVVYWELGNEPYVRDSKLPDGKPNPEFFKAPEFARRLNVVMAAMRKVDPDIKIGVPFTLDTLSGRPWSQWRGEPALVVGEQLGYAEGLLSAIERPQDISFLAIHLYMPMIMGDGSPKWISTLPSDEQLYWAAAAGTETLRKHLNFIETFWAQQPNTRKLPFPTLFVTEYNSFFTNARLDGKEIKQNAYVATQAGAMFVADLIMMMSHDKRIGAAMQWSLNGNWIFGSIFKEDGGEVPAVRPVYYVMKMARDVLQPGGNILTTTVETEKISKPDQRTGLTESYPNMPLAEALTTLNGKTIKVMVINKHPTRNAVVNLDFLQRTIEKSRAEQLASREIFAAADTPGASSIEQPKIDVGADGHRAKWNLPPSSVAVFTAELK